MKGTTHWSNYLEICLTSAEEKGLEFNKMEEHFSDHHVSLLMCA